MTDFWDFASVFSGPMLCCSCLSGVSRGAGSEADFKCRNATLRQGAAAAGRRGEGKERQKIFCPGGQDNQLKRLSSDKGIQAFFFDFHWLGLAGFGWIWLDLAKFGIGLDNNTSTIRLFCFP
jgi:hypothetical protein